MKVFPVLEMAAVVSWMKCLVCVPLLPPLSQLASLGMKKEGRKGVLNTKESIADGGISDRTGRITVCKIPFIQVSPYIAIAFYVLGTKERLRRGLLSWRSPPFRGINRPINIIQLSL